MRLSKTVDGVTTKHVWDRSQQIIADVVDGQFYEADCYLRGTNLVATYSYENGAKSDYTYYTQNAHGDVVNLTDAQGAITKSYTYDAFGVEQNIDDSDSNAFRYCGEYYDAETGTIYLRARYYDPSTGRFISRDSYAGKNDDPLSLNLYTYCYNNPIIYEDPSGNNPLVLGLAIGATVVIAAAITYAALSSTPQGQKSLRSAGNALGELGRSVESKYRKAKSKVFEAQIYSAVLTFALAKSQAKAIAKSLSNKRKSNQDVYLLYDPNNQNEIMYVGRTDNWKQREVQHQSSSTRSQLKMLVIAEDIPYESARGLEQWGIEYYNTLNKNDKRNNQINGVSLINPLRNVYIMAAVPYASNLKTVMYENKDGVTLKRRT